MHRFLPVFLAATLHAQSGDFRLRLLDPHIYRERELIRMEMPEPSGGWYFAGLLIQPPPADCGTEAKPCYPRSMGMSPGEVGIGSPRTVRAITVNHFVTQLGPGRYRVRALLRKQTPAESSESDAVEFQVVAADAAWVQATMAANLAILYEPQAATREQVETSQAAAQQLVWLDTPASRDAALTALPREEGLLLSALLATRDMAGLCDRMQALLPAPAQTVSSYYLSVLTQSCERANLAPIPLPAAASGTAPREVRAVLSATPPKGPVAQPDPAMVEWSRKQRAYSDALRIKVTAALAASLPSKLPEPRWAAMVTLLDYLRQFRADHPGTADPSWVPALVNEFVRAYPSAEVSRQRFFLEIFTSAIRSPEVVPLLLRTLDSWKPGDYYEAVHAAIRSLNDLDPALAQARIRAELTRPQTWLDRNLLEMLPPSAVPPMDDALIRALAIDQQPGNWNPSLRMAAIARYATPAALPRLKAIYESQQDRCQPELLAYFVRVEPAYADRVFHQHPWDMQAMPPPCIIQIFQRVPPLAMSPGLQAYLTAYLMHSQVHIKTTAARVLARWGTPSAVPSLWDTLRYFREWWKGKEAQLAQNGEAISLEVELRNAIARGRNWLAKPEDLRLLESLCTSGWCRDETRQDLSIWESPLRIELQPQYNRVAQYGGLENLDAVKTKLAQFPSGTVFTVWSTYQVPESFRDFARSHGITLAK